MDDNYKKAINEHRQGLENDLIVLNFVSSLHEVCKPPGFLNDREIGTIKDARTRYDKVGELLDLLLGKGNNAFESFCVILSKNGYAGWATKLLVSAGIDRGQRIQQSPCSVLCAYYYNTYSVDTLTLRKCSS